MGSLSIWHWMIVGAVVLLVFGGRGKISDMMGDVAKGIKAFKKGMADDDTAGAPPKPTRRSRPSTIRRPPTSSGAPNPRARSSRAGPAVARIAAANGSLILQA